MSREIEADGVVFDGSWSPVGTRIAYLSRVHQNAPLELFTNSVEGTDNQRVHIELEEGGLVAFGYQWSPDGSRLAYMAGESGQWANIYTAAPDGSDRKMVAPTTYPRATHSGLVRWSPDGRLLAYFSAEGGATEIAIRTSEPDGTNSQVISLPLEEGEELDELFSWSPDSAWIAYVTSTEGIVYVSTLYVARADGTGARKVYEGLDSFLFWAHDFAWVLIDE